MKPADESILRFLRRYDELEFTTGNLARNIPLDRSYASSRLSVLAKKGFVEKDEPDTGYPFYSISSRGVAFLDGDLDPDDIN